MANKQTTIILRKNYNLCEINPEYPLSSKQSIIPRDLPTSGKEVKTCQCGHVHQSSNKIPSEPQGKNPKTIHEQTEVFLNNPEEEQPIHKGRYRRNYAHHDNDYTD